jgi:hypothetical protein
MYNGILKNKPEELDIKTNQYTEQLMVKSLLLRNKFCWLKRLYVLKAKLTHCFTFYHMAVAIGFIIALSLALAIPIHMAEPDDWAYFYGVKNFSQGHFTVDNQTHFQQVIEAQQQGGQLGQYVNIGSNRWALEKAPGYPLYLVPFYLLGIPRAGNILLALGTVIVVFMLLKRLRDAKTAMIGSLLILFTPFSLIMLNRAYIDTYASMSFLTIGGGLYIYYHLEQSRLGRAQGKIILFLAFLLVSWSVVTRYTNLPVAIILVLHLMVTRTISWRKNEKMGIQSELLPILIGFGLPAASILGYDYFVFGSPLDYGYRYSRADIQFAFHYLGQVNQNGQSIPLQIIWNNLRFAPQNLLVGFPLLIIGIPGLGVVLYNKFTASKTIRIELPWDILLILIGWFISVFFLYLTYEWTARLPGANIYFHFDRFYLPGLFPVVVMGALVMARFSFKVYVPILAILIGFGIILFLQTSVHWNILPGWLINGPNGGTPPRRVPPGRFPGGRLPDGSPLPFPPGNLPGNGGGYFPQSAP